MTRKTCSLGSNNGIILFFVVTSGTTSGIFILRDVTSETSKAIMAFLHVLLIGKLKQ